MSDWLGLHDANVLIAGAGTLGGALVDGFVQAGARVAVIDISAEHLQALGDRSGIAPERLITADLTDPEAARQAIATGRSLFGGLDVFVHGVGINDRRPISDYAAE